MKFYDTSLEEIVDCESSVSEGQLPIQWRHCGYYDTAVIGVPDIVVYEDHVVVMTPDPISPESRRSAMQCGALQFRKALRALGKMEAVKAYVEQADEETQEAWEYATEFRRLNPFIVTGMAALGVSDEDVDAVFELAMTL